jgi:hypothetical protein
MTQYSSPSALTQYCSPNQCLVGQTPWPAAGPLAGFLRRAEKADEGVGRGPGGPPHQVSEP